MRYRIRAAALVPRQPGNIIGDGKQLLHITTLSVAQDREIATRSGVPNDQQLSMGYRTTSLFSLAARSVGEAPLFLEEHYRSHKAIITFSNDLFYGSRLIILTDEGAEESSAPVRWVQVAGEARRGPRGRASSTMRRSRPWCAWSRN